MRVKFLSQILLFLAFSMPAQQTVLKNFSTRNGLPSNEVYFLLSDSKGYIWICTDAGIAKYNGNFFRCFNSSNGLPDNTIFEVKEDKTGRVWFRSFSGKVGYIINDSVYTIDANSEIEKFVNNGIVSSFAVDEDGTLYVGKRNSDKCAFLKIAPPYGNNNVSTVWESAKVVPGCEVLLVGNDFVFSETRGNARQFVVKLFDESHHLLLESEFNLNHPGLFTRLSRSGDNVFLLANKEMISFDLRKSKISKTKFTEDLITAIRMDSLLLVGGRGSGLQYLNLEFGELPKNRLLKGYTFTYAVKDYQGGTWYSSLEAGIFYHSKQELVFDEPEEGRNQIADIITENDSTLFIGYTNGQIIRAQSLHKKNISFTPIYLNPKSVIGKLISFFRFDEENDLVTGDRESILINRFNYSTLPIYKKKERLLARDLLCRGDTVFMVGISQVRICKRSAMDSALFTAKTEDRLNKIVFDSATGGIFLGGIRGMYKFNFQPIITKADRILDCRVEDLKSSGGRVYIATRGLGLIIKSGNHFDTISEKTGLLSNICKAVTVNGNCVWVSTNNGVSKISFGRKSFSINNFDLNNFSDAASVNKICLFGDRAEFYSGSRLYSFDTLIQNANSLFYISQFKVNDVISPKAENVLLKYNQAHINISYEALFYDCNQIQYRYKIRKGDSTWVKTNESSVNFPQLAPGEYHFVVEARNRRGDWVRAASEIDFVIEKPFWQKAWFIVLEIVLAGGLILLVIRNRYNKLLEEEKNRNDLRFRMTELETRAIKAQMDPHFIFNALNSIQQFVLEGDTDNAYKYLSRFSKLVRKLLESNTSETISLEDEIDILRRYLEIESSRFEEAFTYNIEQDPALQASRIQIPHMLIQPFVENAIWHGLLHKKEDKKLNIRFGYLDEKRLSCIVEDNGVGRNFRKAEQEKSEKKSLAMSLIQQRLELIKKTKNIDCGFQVTDNSPGSGTVVKIIIPILNKI